MTITTKKTPPSLRERLQIILLEQQLKQTEFARSLGISVNYVYLLTSGKKTAISPLLARLIESTYDYSALWVLTGEGEKTTGLYPENLKEYTIAQIKRLSSEDLKEVADFIKKIEEAHF